MRPDRTVGGAQPRAIALPPDHALVVGGGDFAAMLDQRAVSVEQQLGVIKRATITLVDADAGHDTGFAARCTYLPSDIRGHDDCLLKQAQMLLAHGEGRLHKRKVRVVRHHSFREHRELNVLATQVQERVTQFGDRGFTGIQHRTELNGCGRE